MTLLEFETALGRSIRTRGGARAECLGTLTQSAGFRFTAEVQRSWCVGRAERAATLTLSVIQEPLRRQLLDEWIDGGGGTSSFFAAESAAFLSFIEARLPEPSHELTACRLERATLRAAGGAGEFAVPHPVRLCEGCGVRRHRLADAVVFYGDPVAIVKAFAERGPLPDVSAPQAATFFGPGIEDLQRPAMERELAIWRAAEKPCAMRDILAAGFRRAEVALMVREGLLELE